MLAVGAVVGAAFLAVSLAVMDRGITEEWIRATPHVLAAVDIAGREVVLTSAALRVAAALGAFASLYFVAVALGDADNREAFLDDELRRIRRVMAAWAYYRGALADGADDARPASSSEPAGGVEG